MKPSADSPNDTLPATRAPIGNVLDRLDADLARLVTRRNALRQEKIVEEIEVILSSGKAPDQRGR